jgi:hypothetical protein
MIILGENIEKLKMMEDNYISQNMGKNTAGFFNYHANDLDIAKKIGTMNADGSIRSDLIINYKKPLEALAKSRYKHEFCLSAITNFDEYMKIVDPESTVADREKEEIKKALETYAGNLDEYNNQCSEKLKKELGIGTDKDINANNLKEQEDKTDSYMIDYMTSDEMENRIREAMSEEELQQENNGAPNPLGTREQTLESILGSVADFIFNAYKYIANSISGFWNRPQQEEVYESGSLDFPDEERTRGNEL